MKGSSFSLVETDDLFKVKSGDAPTGGKLHRRGDGSEEDRKRPFELKETVDSVDWYWVYDGDGGPAARLAKYFLRSEGPWRART